VGKLGGACDKMRVENIKEKVMTINNLYKSKSTFILNLHSTQSQVRIPVTAGDTARVLEIGFSDGGGLYKLDGMTVKVTIKKIAPEVAKSEKSVTEGNNFISVGGEYMYYYFDETTCPTPGIYVVEIGLYRDGKRIASPKFSIDAEESIYTEENLTQ
jgi:hypothetical protein